MIPLARKYFFAGLGIFLGLGAPLTHVILQTLLSSQTLQDSFFHELRDHGFWISWVTPFVFGIFGFVLGSLYDNLRVHKEKLEVLSIKLKHQSITDELTGLYNRRHILMQMEREVERSRRYRKSFSVIMADLDNLKEVNDRHGHLTGDMLLKEAAELLQRNIRKIDLVGRYGGDEFLLILPESDLEAARGVAERIQDHVRQVRFAVEESVLSPTLSMGLLGFDGTAQDVAWQAVIQKVDQALLRAKQMGKNQIYVSVAD